MKGATMTRDDLRLIRWGIGLAAALGAALWTIGAVLFGDPDAGI